MTRVAVEVRREQLVESAINVMVREGVAAATTRAIVAEADMPLGAFHYCFRSKQELLGEVIESTTGSSLEVALPAALADGSAADRVRGAMGAYWHHVLGHPDRHRLTYELTSYAARQPDLAAVAERQYATYLTATTKLLGALANENGEPVRWRVSLDTLARYITILLDGSTLLYLNEGDADAAREALDLGVEQIISLIA